MSNKVKMASVIIMISCVAYLLIYKEFLGRTILEEFYILKYETISGIELSKEDAYGYVQLENNESTQELFQNLTACLAEATYVLGVSTSENYENYRVIFRLLDMRSYQFLIRFNSNGAVYLGGEVVSSNVDAGTDLRGLTFKYNKNCDGLNRTLKKLGNGINESSISQQVSTGESDPRGGQINRTINLDSYAAPKG